MVSHACGCQNYVTAANLRRLKPAGVLHATPAFASTRPGIRPLGKRADYRGYIDSQFENHARHGPTRYLPGTRCGQGPPSTRPPTAPPPSKERARRVHHRPAVGYARHRRGDDSVPHPAAKVTRCNYGPRLPSGELVPPVRTDVCSMFARMSRSNPVAAGTTRHPNQVGCHVSSQARP